MIPRQAMAILRIEQYFTQYENPIKDAVAKKECIDSHYVNRVLQKVLYVKTTEM